MRARRTVQSDQPPPPAEQSALSKDPPPEPSRPKRAKPWAGESYYQTYEPLAESISSVDVDATFESLKERLRVGSGAGSQISGAELMTAIDRVQEDLVQAHRLANKARREYELYKLAHESWLEEKKAAALLALEQSKAEKKLTKQITDGMIVDAVMVTWPDEYTDRIQRLKGFQAAVHQIEALSTAYAGRARSLGDLKDLVISFK